MQKKIKKLMRLIPLFLLGRASISKRTYKYSRAYLNKFLFAVESLSGREEWISDAFRVALKIKPGAFVDVGANFGQTLVKKLAIDPLRPYIGFEPQVLACAFIENFLSSNRLDNHVVLPIALSDRSHTTMLGVSRPGDEAASIIDEFRPADFYTDHRYVQVARGDDVLQDIGITSVSLIKIDVEGAELEVLKGFSRTIASQRPFVVFEVLPNFLHRTKVKIDPAIREVRAGRLAKISAFFSSNEYRVVRLSQGSNAALLESAVQLQAHDRETQYFLAMAADDETAFLTQMAERLPTR